MVLERDEHDVTTVVSESGFSSELKQIFLFLDNIVYPLQLEPVLIKLSPFRMLPLSFPIL